MMKLQSNLSLLLVCVSLLVASSRSVLAAPQYFFATSSNTVTGGIIGSDATGNPKDWAACHSQSNGSTAPDGTLRFGGEKGANWTFLWTRKAGDTASYVITPKFEIAKDYKGRVALQVGFSDVYDHTQLSWPHGYWVDNESGWSTLDTSDAAGSVTLSSLKKPVTIPASANVVYLRIYLLDAADSGFVAVSSGTVAFKQSAQKADAAALSSTRQKAALSGHGHRGTGHQHHALSSTRQKADAAAPSSTRQKSVIDYGADPTGVKDSTAAIQKAVDAGGVVVIPSGHFLIRKSVEITKSFTEIKGEIGSTLMLADDAPVDGIRAAPAGPLWMMHDVVVDGVTVVNPDSQNRPGDNMQFTSGILFKGIRGGRIQNCVVKHFQEQGINLVACRDIHVTGCFADGARHGIAVNGNEFVDGQGGSWNVQIDGCHTVNTWDTGIVVALHSNYTSVTNCLVENSWAHGIDIFNCSNAVISANTVHNWNAYVPGRTQTGRSIGIFVHLDWGLTVSIPTRNITVTGNLVIYDAPLAKGLQPAALEVTGDVDGANITGNTLIGSYQAFDLHEQPYDNFYKNRIDKQPAVGPQTPQNVVFCGNVCRGQTGNALEISSVLPMTALISNNVFAPAQTASFKISVHAPSGVIVTGNMFQSDKITLAMLAGLTPSGNVFLPSADTPASQEFVQGTSEAAAGRN